MALLLLLQKDDELGLDGNGEGGTGLPRRNSFGYWKCHLASNITVEVGLRLCLRANAGCNMPNVSVFIFLYAFSYYYFPFFVLSMSLLYLSF